MVVYSRPKKKVDGRLHVRILTNHYSLSRLEKNQQELAKKALEQAFQGKEKEFAKLDDQGNNGSGNGRGDRGGGGGGGGGGNNGEDWGEVFEMAVKIVMYLLLGIVFVIIWPKLFDGATNVYNKMTKKEVVQSKPVKEDFDDEDFDELVRESEAKTTTTTTTTQAASTKTEAKPVKRAFPEREAFDTWQFGAVKGQDAQDELVEKEIQEQTLQEEMLNPGAGFHDQFQAKPRSKHIVLKDTKTMDKPGPYQDYVTGKWK